MRKIVLMLLILMILPTCTKNKGIIPMEGLKITSSAFEHNSNIPIKYTADGENINPLLNIANIPSKTKSLVLIMDDPDAPRGDWVHWLIWNIPPSKTNIDENSIPGTQGLNSFKQNSYSGPSPPSGTHRYFFKIYALDIELSLKPSSKKQDVEQAIKSHILAKGELIGLYTKH